jgi:putative flippase GtrA
MRFTEAIRGRLGGRVDQLVRELGAFGVVGAVAFVVDVGLFQLFYAQLHTGAVTAKVLATLTSMTVAYVGHRTWSFAHRPRTAVREQYLRFAAINGAAMLLGVLVVAFVRYPLGQESALVLQVANLGSIALGTVLRYLGYRWWVFAAAPEAEPDPGEVPRDAAASPEPSGRVR